MVEGLMAHHRVRYYDVDGRRIRIRLGNAVFSRYRHDAVPLMWDMESTEVNLSPSSRHRSSTPWTSFPVLEATVAPGEMVKLGEWRTGGVSSPIMGAAYYDFST